MTFSDLNILINQTTATVSFSTGTKNIRIRINVEDIGSKIRIRQSYHDETLDAPMTEDQAKSEIYKMEIFEVGLLMTFLQTTEDMMKLNLISVNGEEDE